MTERTAISVTDQKAAPVQPDPAVVFAGAGPGSADHLTLAVAHALSHADIILHDALVGPEVLALAHKTAEVIETGKRGFAPSMAQADICALMVRLAQDGRRVLRLKSGDPSVFGRLGEEIAALEAAGLGYKILPGITAASAAAAQIGQSLTERGRNKELRLVTGHDAAGYNEADWRALSACGMVAAIYMGKRAARFLQGRLLMHGAAPATPVSIIENVSRPDQTIIGSTIARLPEDAARCDGPAVFLLGLAPRAVDQISIPREEAL
ncbi:uroporphyrinogen-III C-methyltransferase [Rhodobacteraceae bacterium]|nr:uroporphyrinogen-III C-methyltransferase [Paracoccaceae bacterium]